MKSEIVAVSKIACPDMYQAAHEAAAFFRDGKERSCEYIDPAIKGYMRLDFINNHYFRLRSSKP